MTIPSEVPIASPEAWRGVWLRERSGPTRKGSTTTVGPWHVVLSIGPRIDVHCKGGLRGVMWPSGGHRIELARPGDYDWLPPGDICPRCWSAYREREVEVSAITEDVLDDLATRVAERLLDRMPRP